MNFSAKHATIIFLSFFFIIISNRSFAADYRYFSILAETMRPIDSTIEFDCDDGYLKTTANSTLHVSTQYITQVNLPHGSTVDTVSCYGYDNDANNFFFALYRYRFNGEGNDVFQQVSQEGNSSVTSGYVDLTVGPVFPLNPSGIAVINNEDYSYGLYLSLPKAHANDLYVVRCVVRAKFESKSSFRAIEIK